MEPSFSALYLDSIKHRLMFNDSYGILLDQLSEKKFSWMVEGDETRIMDAIHNRNESIFSTMITNLNDTMGKVNVLEILYVLCDKLSNSMSEESGNIRYWFRILLENSGLSRFTDTWYGSRQSGSLIVDDVLDRIIFRQYSPNGYGGFFPLRYPDKDQRFAELSLQLNNYILERSDMVKFSRGEDSYGLR